MMVDTDYKLIDHDAAHVVIGSTGSVVMPPGWQ